ncbi:MAG TPA: O-antigen ligase family protein [bacterium]|nr:O-antigen ligase family protein [bacterium]
MESAIHGLVYLTFFLVIGILPGIFYPETFDPFELPKLVFIRAGLGLFFLLVLFYRRKSKQSNSQVLPHMIIFIIAMSLSTILSQYRWTSFHGEWERYMGLSSMLPIVLAGLAPVFLDRKKIPLLKYAFLLGLVLVIIRSFRQILGYEIISIDSFGGRLLASLGNPDFLGEYLVMVIPLSMIEAIYSKKRVWKVITFVIFSLTFLALLLSGTRGSWLTFLILLVIMPLIFVKPKTPRFVYRKTVFYVLFTGTLIAMLLYLPATVYIRLLLSILLILWLYLYIRYLYPYMGEEIKIRKISIIIMAIIMIVLYFSLPYITSLIPHRGDVISETLKLRLKAMTEVESGRWYMWKSAFRLIREEMISDPVRLLFGYGLDTTGKYLSHYKDIDSARMDPMDNIVYADRAHNEYLEILLQTGLLGFLTFIILLITTVKKGIEIHRSTHPYRLFATAMTLGVIGFIINGAVIFGTSVTYLYLFVMCGIIGVIYTPRGRLWRIKKDIIYRVIAVFALIFCIYTTYTGLRQLQSHKFLLKGVEAINRGELVSAEEYLDKSIEAYPIGYAFQRKIEIYNIRLREEKSKEAFDKCIGLFPPMIEYVKYPTSVYYAMASIYMDGYELGLDKTMLDKVIYYLKECIEYDKYHKPALRILARIYMDYLKDSESAYLYAKRYVEIEQRDIEMWRLLMRTSKDVKDWETVWFSAKAIYLATEGKDREAERYLRESEEYISPSRNP